MAHALTFEAGVVGRFDWESVLSVVANFLMAV